MARIAVADGIKAVVATPHLLKGYPISPELIVERTLQLNRVLSVAGIPLSVYPGAEVSADPDILPMLHRNELLTLPGAKQYLAIELADYFPKVEVYWLLQELIAAGVSPIIVHPERNILIQRQPEILAKMTGLGANVQVTAMSITGEFGRPARAASRLFLERGWVQMIASDGHSAQERPPVLSRAVAEATRIVGRTAAQEMVSDRFLNC